MAASIEEWFCYMVKCSDGSIYVGIAKDVAERVKRHNWGAGSEYTAKRRPVTLIWSERCENSLAARAREKEIKSWSRAKKSQFVQRAGMHLSPASRARDKGESSNG